MQITPYFLSDFMQNLSEDSVLYQKNISNILESKDEISIENIDEETIIVILRNLIKDSKKEYYKDVFLWLDGGLCITNGTQSIVHQCCNDFSNMEEWRSLLDKENHDWAMFWIGHPWIYTKIDNDFIYLSDYDDDDSDEKVIKFQFPKSDFLTLLQEKITLYDKFVEKVKLIIKNSDLKHKTVLSKALFSPPR
jgi:hypothetical protein